MLTRPPHRGRKLLLLRIDLRFDFERQNHDIGEHLDCGG